MVEDDADLRSLLEELLAAHGFQVIAVGSAGDARAAIGARRPDVVVTDYAMPGESGLELVRTLRADPALRDLGVVVVSGETDRAGIQRAAQAAGASFLPKPFEIEDLLRAIDLVWLGD